MKLTINKDNLQNAVNIVSKVANTTTTMPILECILLETIDNKLSLTGNDLELIIKTSTDCYTADNGKTAINAKTFSEIINKMPSGDITIATEQTDGAEFDNIANISCGKTKFRLSCLDGNDYAQIKDIGKEIHYTSMSQQLLKSMIQRTIFCVSQHDTNKLMTGELLKIQDNEITMTALDGYRIAIAKHELVDHDMGGAVIPSKSLLELSRLLQTEDTIKISISDKFAMFVFNEITLTTRLIDGEYFKVDQLLSKQHNTKLTIDRQTFVACLERAALLNVVGDKKPTLLNITDGVLDVSIRTQQGSMNEQLEVDSTGDKLKIGFNAKFLIDALRVITDKTVTLYFGGAKSPCIIKDADESYLYLILPVNIKE